MAKIGFIGVGNMGGPMALNLLNAGHNVKVFDLSAEAVQICVDAGGEAATSASDTAKGVNIVVSMLPKGDHVRGVYLGADGALAAADEGTLFIDCSTIDVASAREVGEAAAAAGMMMVDAPVSGGVGGAAAGMDMSGGMNMRDTSKLPPSVKVGPGVDMVAMNPVDRMGDPGIGLDKVSHRVLNYKQLVAAKPNPDARRPTRLKEIHLTGNMERYMWSFDGKKYSAVTDDPIRFAYNERVRVKLVNNTMMAHPIHLHGHFFELVNGAKKGNQPLKHTMIVQPGSSAQFDLTADEPGDWAFHCHLLYHMHSGMFQVVTVRPLDGDKS